MLVAAIKSFNLSTSTNLKDQNDHDMKYSITGSSSACLCVRITSAAMRYLFLQALWMSIKTRPTYLSMPASEKEAKGGIDKVVAALWKDKSNAELGQLIRSQILLTVARQKHWRSVSASSASQGRIHHPSPCPFGLGLSNVSEGEQTW
jgi:hypothetical protein